LLFFWQWFQRTNLAGKQPIEKTKGRKKKREERSLFLKSPPK